MAKGSLRNPGLKYLWIFFHTIQMQEQFSNDDFLLKIPLPVPITLRSTNISIDDEVVKASIIKIEGVKLTPAVRHILNYITAVLRLTKISFSSAVYSFTQMSKHQSFIGFLTDDQISEEQRSEAYHLIEIALRRLQSDPRHIDADDKDKISEDLLKEVEIFANQLLLDKKPSVIKPPLDFIFLKEQPLKLSGMLDGYCESNFEPQDKEFSAVVTSVSDNTSQFELSVLDGKKPDLPLFFENRFTRELWSLGLSKEIRTFHVQSRQDGNQKEIFDLIEIGPKNTFQLSQT